jgi:hypothetical protein
LRPLHQIVSSKCHKDGAWQGEGEPSRLHPLLYLSRDVHLGIDLVEEEHDRSTDG